MRGLLRVLGLELFGTNLTLPAFPRVKSLRGIGTSDTEQYAAVLAKKFDYRNTFYDHAPRFDIADPPQEEFGKYDFVISSEVFEHVPPPIEQAFAKTARLLKPNGVLVLTLPYSIEDQSLEHFPDLYEYTVAQVGGESVLVNRTREGQVQVYENLVFHLGSGAALEMPELCEKDLMPMLSRAGFADVKVHGESYEAFGVLYPENWSLPIAARRGSYALGRDAAREIVDELVESRAEVERLKKHLDALPARNRPWARLRRAARTTGQ
ncbi:MAG TPA: class I SAM-dependent methyltransferase [Bryobacteraceae bacterium]|nr:class I SAM-dependent methyltransferase [Bryobacteraceae bacterium]